MENRIHYGNSNRDQREFVESRIRASVNLCSSLVDDLLKADGEGKGLKGFSYDDIQNVYSDPSKWSAEKCAEYLEERKGKTEAASIIADAHKNHGEGDSFDADGYLEEIRDVCRDLANEDPAEIYEWWEITDSWIADALKDMGECYIDNDYGFYWGRTCTGQAISLDPTFWTILQDHLPKE